jgi:hypothetical protein
MSETEAIQIVQTLVENDPSATDALVGVYLQDAEAAILRRLYPFGGYENAAIPPVYELLWCKLAARYFLRRGAEGEIVHEENGINRQYGSVGDEDLLREVTPYVWVAGK